MSLAGWRVFYTPLTMTFSSRIVDVSFSIEINIKDVNNFRIWTITDVKGWAKNGRVDQLGRSTTISGSNSLGRGRTLSFFEFVISIAKISILFWDLEILYEILLQPNKIIMKDKSVDITLFPSIFRQKGQG